MHFLYINICSDEKDNYSDRRCLFYREEHDGKKIKSEPQTLLPKQSTGKEKAMDSRYGMINEMCRALAEQNEEEVKKQAMEYRRKEKLAEHFLPLR